MAKDETIIGLTGKPVPKPRSAKKQYELEKKRREARHLGKNVGGVQYKSDVNPYYNPRARTFREFVEITENVSTGSARRASFSRAPIAQRVSDAEAKEIRRRAQETSKPVQEKPKPQPKGPTTVPSRGISADEPALRRKTPEGHRKRGGSPESIAKKKARLLSTGDDMNASRGMPRQKVDDKTKARAKKIREILKNKKNWGTKKEEYEMIANYLYNEGFIIDSIEELDEIIESMSDELKNEILEIVEAKEAKPPQEVLNKISKAYSRKHRGVNVSASHRKSGDIRLDDIWIPPSERNKGIGSRAMKGLTKYADKQGKRITLNQAPEPGKKEKLKQFYQKHGFKPNTGRSRDLSVSDTHIRNPQKSESFSYSSPEYQEKLMKDREKKKKRQETERQQRNSELYRQRKTKGIHAYSKGQSGWIIDGKFTPDS